LTIIERRCLLLLVIEGDLGLRLLLVFDGSAVAVDEAAAATAVDDGSKRCNSRTLFGLSSSCGADCFSEDIVASVESIIGIADDDESCISMMMLIFTYLTIDTTIVS
jgi:hypothetical protein